MSARPLSERDELAFDDEAPSPPRVLLRFDFEKARPGLTRDRQRLELDAPPATLREAILRWLDRDL